MQKYKRKKYIYSEIRPSYLGKSPVLVELVIPTDEDFDDYFNLVKIDKKISNILKILTTYSFRIKYGEEQNKQKVIFSLKGKDFKLYKK